MTKAVGIIPARWGSTRFPGKPLHLIAGKPLLRHVWERCRRAKKLDRLIIATDDFRIAEAAFDWGAEVALTSANHVSGTDRIADVAKKLKQFTHIVNVQGDEPLIDPKLIDRLVREMQRDKKLEMITAAHPFENVRDAESPHQVKVVLDLKGNALYFSRAKIPASRSGGFQTADALVVVTPLSRQPERGQQTTRSYGDRTPSLQQTGRFGKRASLFRHQGIYGYRRDLLLRFVRWKTSPLERIEALEQLRALENGVRIRVVMTGSGSPGVDTPEDARMIEHLISSAGHRVRGRKRSSTG